jgi:bacterioferritin-associated ferredoxin
VSTNLSHYGPDDLRPFASVACKSCGCPFPQESSEAPKLHGAIWECGACQDSKREILISELKEKARLKALEREQRELVKR